MLHLTGHTQSVTALAYSPDGRLLASAGWDGSVRLWDMATRQQCGLLQTDCPHALAVDFAPGGDVLAVGFSVNRAERSGNIGLWRLVPGASRGKRRQVRYEFELISRWGNSERASTCWCVRFSPDGKGLATPGAAMHSAVWDVRTQQLAHSIELGDFPHAIDFSRDGRWLAATGHLNGGVQLWDLHANKQLAKIRGGHSRGISIRIRSDMRQLAYNRGEVVYLWTIGPNSPVPLAGHESEVREVLYTPDERELLSVGFDGLAKFWDTATGELRQTLDWQLNELNCAAFAPDGTTVAVGNMDGRILLWDVDAW